MRALRRVRPVWWPLAVTLAVVALTVLLVDATPRRLTGVADEAVAAAVREAGRTTDLVVRARYDDAPAAQDPGGVETTATVDQVARRLDENVPAELATLLGPPVATVTTTPLTSITRDGLPGPSVQLAYVWREGGPGVDWVEGSEPGPTAVDETTVQVALSEEVATLLGVHAGDRTGFGTPDGGGIDALVSGVFTARNPADPAWSAAPVGMLSPRTRGTGLAATTDVGALLSAPSLTAVRAVLAPDLVRREFRFAVDPAVVTRANADALGAAVAALEANPRALQTPGSRPEVTSRLDQVLTAVQGRVAAASSQAAVLFTGLAVSAGFVLVVAARLLAHRRALALRTSRARGASLTQLAGEAGLESLVVVALGAAAGLAAAARVTPGAVSWTWVVPVLAIAVLAPVGAALATVGRGVVRRVPVERHQRQAQRRVRSVRRLALEAAVVALALASLVALQRRGVVSFSGPADLLLAAAPTLVAAAGALLLLRAVPPVLSAVLRAARRSRRAEPLLAAARASVRSRSAAAFAAVVVTTSLVTLGAGLAVTVRAGQVDGSWDAVGADVAVRGPVPDAALGDLAAALAEADGVRATVAARVQRVQVFGVRGVDRARVLVVDPGPFGALLAATPFGAAAGLDRITTTGRAAVPVLADGGLADGASVRWDESNVPVEVVAPAPDLPPPTDDEGSADVTLVVDRAALAAATGEEVVPDVVWVVGPGADVAVQRADIPARAEVASRAQWLAARHAEPLTVGLSTLLLVAVGALTTLGVLVVVLDAAASAPERATALTSARVVGLGRRGASRVAAGEMLPHVLVAALGGVGLGVLLAVAVTGPLALRLVTGQLGEPAVVVPWWALSPVALLGVTVMATSAAEAVLRRRDLLGPAMRVV